MLTTLHRLMGTSSALRNRVVGVYLFLALFNLVAWGLALGASAAYPILLRRRSSPTRSACATP